MWTRDNTGGRDWLWATFMVGLWVVLIEVVVYVGIRLAHGDGGSRA